MKRKHKISLLKLNITNAIRESKTNIRDFET